ncbi:MAG: hypothetical protein WCB18_00090 [Thermoplasmata archaeon]
MFGIPSARIAEMSRPDYAREVADYTRLEYPQEDSRTVILQALAAIKEHPTPPRRHFWSFRSGSTATEVVSNKA